MAKVMVLGAGSFGTALALLCHRCGHEVTVSVSYTHLTLPTIA